MSLVGFPPETCNLSPASGPTSGGAFFVPLESKACRLRGAATSPYRPTAFGAKAMLSNKAGSPMSTPIEILAKTPIITDDGVVGPWA
jgi:hypothetical protein